MTGEIRLYGGAIGIVSGSYSIASAVAGMEATLPVDRSVMLVIGVVVLVHGILLLTPAAQRLGRSSGPLMVLWAAIMIGNELLRMRSGGPMIAMTWDGGMIALAILMLTSGLIMTRTRAM